jgi:hypothetical protein
MSRVLTGTVLLAALALAGTGCDTINEAKDTVDTASNTVEVCQQTIQATNERITKVNDVASEVVKNPNDPAAAQKLKIAVISEFSALHTSLQEQASKAKDADVKAGIEALDAAVAGWAANPDSFSGQSVKYSELAGAINKACGAK